MIKEKMSKEEYIENSLNRLDKESLIATAFQFDQGLIEAVKKYDSNKQVEFFEWFYDLTEGLIMIDELYEERDFLLSLMGMIYIDYSTNYILETNIGSKHILNSFEKKDRSLNMFFERIIRIVQDGTTTKNKDSFLEQVFLLTPKRYKMHWLDFNKMSLDLIDRTLYPTFFLETYKSLEYGFENTNLENLEEYKEEIEKTIYSKKKLPFDAKGYLEIYRGEGSKSQPLHKHPSSWTTSKEVARFFATRFDDEGKIHTGIIHKDDVYAMFENESEVLIKGEKVKIVE